ncbi:MAG: hypothetical protein ACOYMG_23525 [Candidatus Methylumidiphilus sp.]
MTTSYFPSTEAARLGWAIHYRDLIAVHGPTVGLSAEEPEFSLSFEQGPEVHRVSISFTKYGHDGVWIESRINNGEWLSLGADNSKPHYDTRPLIDPNLPEVREYRLRWWDKGEPNGEFSPVQKIVAGG